MDISGYRARGRAQHVIQSTYAYHSDPAGKRKRKPGLSLGAKAFLIILCLLLIWGAIRRAGPKRQQAAVAATGGAGHAAAAVTISGAAGGAAAGAAAGGAQQVSSKIGSLGGLTAEKLDQQLEARIERQVGGARADFLRHACCGRRLELDRQGCRTDS